MITYLFKDHDPSFDIRISAIEKFCDEVNCDLRVKRNVIDMFENYTMDNPFGVPLCKIEDKDRIRYYEEVVIPHKKHVFVALMQLRNDIIDGEFLNDAEIDLLLTQAVLHDLSKFTIAEDGYINKFIASPDTEILDPIKVKRDFKYAWMHHIKVNAHHPEYWIMFDDTQQVNKVMNMPDRFIAEMLADWIGAGQSYETDWKEYLTDHYSKKIISTETDAKLRVLIKNIYEFDLPSNDFATKNSTEPEIR